MGTVTAIVLALNEADLIARCIHGLKWADEILVVDSGSTDNTERIAVAEGARFEKQSWLGWTGQHNAAAALATHDWVFFVDADEFADEKLQQAVRHTVDRNPPKANGYAVDRREEYLGALLGQAQRRTKMMSRVRLYNRTVSEWDIRLSVHERVVFSGQRILLQGRLYHWRRETLEQRIERMTAYSKLEADIFHAEGRSASIVRMLVQPAMRFVWLFFLKRDFLRGKRGLSHSAMRAFADVLRASFLLEREIGPTPKHPPVYVEPER